MQISITFATKMLSCRTALQKRAKEQEQFITMHYNTLLQNHQLLIKNQEQLIENQLKLIQLNTKSFSSASVDEDFSFSSEPFKNLHDLKEFCKMLESNEALRHTLVWTSNIAYFLILLICSNCLNCCLLGKA